MKVTKIGVLSLGYILAIFGLLMGLISDLTTLLLVKNPVLGLQFLGQAQMTSLSSGYLWLLTQPLFSTIGSFIGGVISAWIYNILVVRITGGLSIGFSTEDNKKK